MRVIDQLFDELDLKTGTIVLEVGCGTGAIVRRLAGRSRGANPIVAADVNSYLMREAAALAEREGLDGYIEFHPATPPTCRSKTIDSTARSPAR